MQTMVLMSVKEHQQLLEDLAKYKAGYNEERVRFLDRLITNLEGLSPHTARAALLKSLRVIKEMEL
jgi:hypothetical protein